MRPLPRAAASTRALLLSLALLWSLALFLPRPAFAATAQDTTAAQPIVTPSEAQVTPSEPTVTSKLHRTGEETDRVELGGGFVKSFFDVAGSLAYRRLIGESRTLERNLMVELTGSAKDQLTEGIVSVYLLLRPTVTYRESSRIRPLLEFGPAVHTVVQVASLEGLDKTRYKSQIYIKSHAYAGFEVLVTDRFGFLVRGRMSVPSRRPLDYAQAAIFLR